MKVKIIAYGNKKSYAARLIAGEYSKEIRGQANNSAVRNTLIAAVKAIKKIKYPVDLEVVSCRNSFNQVIAEGIKKHKNQYYVRDNLKLWQEYKELINQHKSYKYTSHTENKADLMEFEKLYKSCI